MHPQQTRQHPSKATILITPKRLRNNSPFSRVFKKYNAEEIAKC